MERGANRQEPVWIRIWLICFLCRNGGNMEQKKKTGKNHILQENRTRRGSADLEPYHVRRDYKSTLFATIFNDRERALSLYNAVRGTDYKDPEHFEIVTLHNALYMNMENDLSILIDAELYLFEHQSTVNPNMPLRDLFYVSRHYQKLVGDIEIYYGSAKKIPEPFFVTLYNGVEEQPERCEMRLSDLYEPKTGREPNLELKVVQLNINPGYNEPLKKCCKALDDYVKLVEKVRYYQKDCNLDMAVERATEESIREGILADFLKKEKQEAQQMIIYDMTDEEIREVVRRAARAEGLEEGREEGREQGLEEGRKLGIELKCTP